VRPQRLLSNDNCKIDFVVTEGLEPSTSALSGGVPVFVRIFPDDFSYVRTKSDTVNLFDVLQIDEDKSRLRPNY